MTTGHSDAEPATVDVAAHDALACGPHDPSAYERVDLRVAGDDVVRTAEPTTTVVPSTGRRLLVLEVEDVTGRRGADVATRAAVTAAAHRRDEVALLRRRPTTVRTVGAPRPGARLRRVADRDRTVAHALRQAMIPELPRVSGLELASHYVAAAADANVGGDWYDVVTGPPRHAGGHAPEDRREGATVVIGDVVGHDTTAAASMGRLRTMLRACIWSERGPAAALSRLDAATLGTGSAEMATAVVVALEYLGDAPGAAAAGWGMTWSNAGHPPPMVVMPDGAVRALTGTRPDLMLGVGDPPRSRQEHRVVLPVGATVLLYTDGIIESRTMDLDTGIRRLLALLAGAGPVAPRRLVDAVIAELISPCPRDDVAVLAVRLGRPVARFPASTFTPADAAPAGRAAG